MVASLSTGCAKSQAPVSEPNASTTQQPTEVKVSFPEHDITGVVQWGAGGGTDSLMRPLSTIAEKTLGKSIVIQNKTGGTGAIATQYVHDQKSDGYTLLMGAENPQLYTMLEISELTYADFKPVFLIGDEKVGVIVAKDSKYKTFTDLINDALANPGKVSIATTGKGGMPWSVSSFIDAVTGAEFNQIPFDSDASALTAVLGGHADFTICKVQSGIESYKAGKINYLTLLSKEKVEVLSEVPLVVDEYADFANYLPWGPFYGIFVNKDTSDDVVKVLSDAFSTAFKDAQYQDLLQKFNISPLGLTGTEAEGYLKTWQKNTAEAFYKSGAIDKSPAELGIE
jgi:tripartite-type tricarboxylate transporter receptor subunit TctC